MLQTNEIIDFFKLENSHAKKELGQNFLINNVISKRIIDSLDINDDDKVLEIGPGLGALTDNLIDIKKARYTVCEYDQKFVNFLHKSYDEKPIEIVKSDILKFRDYDFNKAIGNLPYYITTDILEHIILHFNKLEKGVFMVQKECLRRITALSGKDYNAINVTLNYLFDTKELFIVRKECFFPAPKVESIVFSITRKKDKDVEFAALLYKISKICFLNRRKTILNNLGNSLKDKELVKEILKELNLKETSRAEELKVNDFISLTENLHKKNII